MYGRNGPRVTTASPEGVEKTYSGTPSKTTGPSCLSAEVDGGDLFAFVAEFAADLLPGLAV